MSHAFNTAKGLETKQSINTYSNIHQLANCKNQSCKLENVSLQKCKKHLDKVDNNKKQ